MKTGRWERVDDDTAVRFRCQLANGLVATLRRNRVRVRNADYAWRLCLDDGRSWYIDDGGEGHIKKQARALFRSL